MERSTISHPLYGTPEYDKWARKSPKHPVIIGLQGHPTNLKWVAQAPDGSEMTFDSYELASDAADAWITMRCLFDTPQDRVGLTYIIYKVKSNEDEEGNTSCEQFDLSDEVVCDFFSLVVVGRDGTTELLADSESCLALGRVAAFLVKAQVKLAYESLRVESRRSGFPMVMTLDDFYTCINTGIGDDSWINDRWTLDIIMRDRLGCNLWDAVSKYY